MQSASKQFYGTGSSIRMKKSGIKFLTIVLGLLLSLEVFAAVVTQENAKTHLRYKIAIQKDLIIVNKRGDEVIIKSLNPEMFKKVSDELIALKQNPDYIKQINVMPKAAGNAVSILKIKLSNPDVELFTFYKDREKYYVLDFWTDADTILNKDKKIAKKAKKSKKQVKSKRANPVAKTPKGKSSTQKNVLKRPTSNKLAKNTKKKKSQRKRNKKYRDFRYGASFIWDYKPLAPSLKEIVNLSRKTPEFFFPIKNRKYSKNEKEAHVQLSINLYRKKKYGLMYKSIELFKQKYGEEELVDINEYLKANAILRENIEKGNTEPVKTAMAMLSNIAERTDNYELKKGIYKYLMTSKIQNKDYIKLLDLAKKFYISSKENFDYEESGYAAELILHSLTNLQQIEKLRELVQDKTLMKLVPPQLMIAYEIYTLLSMNKPGEVIKAWKKNKKGMVKPIHSAILYNVAEAYFRNAEYQKALRFYDDFITNYNFMTESGPARTRLALCYEILEKNVDQTLELYKRAINRSRKFDSSFEARIRFTALRTVRKNKRSSKDMEMRALLKIKDTKKKPILSRDLKKLLWLVRLRTFLTDGKYKEALSYLSVLPLNSLKPSEKRVYEGDGAEAIYGIMINNYKSSEYGKVIKAWEVYKEKYVDKVAMDPFLNFIVGKSYIKLGVFSGFDDIYKSFSEMKKSPARTFPVWVKRHGMSSSSVILEELKLSKNMKLKNWDLALSNVNQIKKMAPRYDKVDFYKGMIQYNRKNYRSAEDSFENYLSSQEGERIFDPTDLASMLDAYTDSIYQSGNYKKFQKVSSAILKDTRNFGVKNELMLKVKEKINYLSLEILAGKNEKGTEYLMVARIKRFLKTYKNSSYKGRLQYLLGLSLADTKKEKEAMKVFNNILKDESISEYIKEMVKSELSLLKIKNQAI
ncbi:MAG: tetratricopeptide repeat protein [Bacteriovoracaceae bacterium]|nr:tetratricopeptide repeat protein [Bacteriovoracaceae bacterium]